jgi:Flavoprotein
VPAAETPPVLYVVACGGPPAAELPDFVCFARDQGWDEPDVLPPADAFVVAPATFSTINRWALGISDTLALGLLNEAVGLGRPMAAVPWPNAALARHPAFQRSVAALREWGIRVILDPARLPDAAPGPAVFPWPDLRSELAGLRRDVGR